MAWWSPTASAMHAQWSMLWASEDATPFDPTTVPLRALVATAGAIVLALVSAATHVLQVRHPYLDDALLLSTSAVLLQLAIRVALALQRRHTSRLAFTELTSAVQSLVSLACSFLMGVDKRHLEQLTFVGDLKRFLLVYVALALQDAHARDHAPRDELCDLLDQDEANALTTTRLESSGKATWNRGATHIGSTNKLRATVLELWLRRSVHRAVQHDLVAAAHAIELNRDLSMLPRIYARVLSAASAPPQWLRARCTHVAVMAHLLLYTIVRMPLYRLGTPLWVFVCGVFLFAIDAVASVTEQRRSQSDDDDSDANIDCHLRLLCLQDELQATIRDHVEHIGVEDEFNRLDRSIQPRTTPSCPRARPSALVGPPPGSPADTDLRKHRVSEDKQVEMATTISSTATLQDDEERRPLLRFTFSRNNSLLRYDRTTRLDSADAEQTDDDDDEDEAHDLNEYSAV